MAFDPKMLQIKQKATGVGCVNPLQGTLLLSAVVPPVQEKHHIEAVVRCAGSGGDRRPLEAPVVICEMISKPLPLSPEEEIDTLKQALGVTLRSSHARIKS